MGAAATGIMLAATLAGVIGIAAAYVFYVKSPEYPDRLMNRWQALYRGSLNKWYVDEAYDKAFVNPTFVLADRMWKKVDVAIIDNAVNGVARGFGLVGVDGPADSNRRNAKLRAEHDHGRGHYPDRVPAFLMRSS